MPNLRLPISSDEDRQKDKYTCLLCEGGAVPSPELELELALLDGAERAQPHAVHEHRVPLAEVDLEIFRKFAF